MPPPLMAVRLAADLLRPRTGPQSAHGEAAGSQRAYDLGQLRRGTDRRTVSLNAPVRRGRIMCG